METEEREGQGNGPYVSQDAFPPWRCVIWSVFQFVCLPYLAVWWPLHSGTTRRNAREIDTYCGGCMYLTLVPFAHSSIDAPGTKKWYQLSGAGREVWAELARVGRLSLKPTEEKKQCRLEVPCNTTYKSMYIHIRSTSYGGRHPRNLENPVIANRGPQHSEPQTTM